MTDLDRRHLELRVDPVEPRIETHGVSLAWIAVAVFVILAVLAFATSRAAAQQGSSPLSITPLGDAQLLGAPRVGGSLDPRKGNQIPVLVGPGLREALPPGGAPLPSVAQAIPLTGSVLALRPVSGWATYCAPTPTRCQSWGGGRHLGAVPSFHYGDDPYLVKVCSDSGCTQVLVVSYCACGDRNGIPTVIDLSPAAFRDIAPLSVGVVRVTLSAGSAVPLPQTDTVP